MNIDDATAWVRQHKAVAAGIGGTAILVLLYLRHRAKTQTASQTAGTTGATTTGAGDYTVPYSSTSDPTGQLTDQGAGNLATAISGLTTQLGNLTVPRSTDPTASQPKAAASTAPSPGSTQRALSAHQRHLLHLQHVAATEPHKLSRHQLHVLHLERTKHAPVKTPAPSAKATATSAHTGVTSKPGGTVSTGSVPPPRVATPTAPISRPQPIYTPPPIPSGILGQRPIRLPVLTYA